MNYKFLIIFLVFNVLYCQKSHLKTFYKGENGTQYFIKPITFESIEKENISIDFTLNIDHEKNTEINSNFSISENRLDSIKIGNYSFGVNKLFDDYETKKYYSRYTFKLNLISLIELLDNGHIVLNEKKFYIKKSFKKKSITLLNIFSDFNKY